MTHRVCPENVILVAQFLLTGTLIGGFFALLYLVTLGRANIEPDLIRVLDTGLGAAGTMSMSSVSYWFARQRSASPPENAGG